MSSYLVGRFRVHDIHAVARLEQSLDEHLSVELFYRHPVGEDKRLLRRLLRKQTHCIDALMQPEEDIFTTQLISASVAAESGARFDSLDLVHIMEWHFALTHPHQADNIREYLRHMAPEHSDRQAVTWKQNTMQTPQETREGIYCLPITVKGDINAVLKEREQALRTKSDRYWLDLGIEQQRYTFR